MLGCRYKMRAGKIKMIQRTNFSKKVDAKLRQKLEIREVANGEVLRAVIPMVNQGVTLYIPGEMWLDIEVMRRYPNARPFESSVTDGDKVRLYWNEAA